jgi:hypothetical protein
MKIFSIAAWEIWNQRNAIIFRGIPPTFLSWKDSFFSTIKLQLYSCDLCNLNIEEYTDTSFSGAYLAQIAGIFLVPMES